MRIIALSLALLAAPAAATTYDAFTSFNGTQGAGNFFYGSLHNGMFTQFAHCSDVNLTYCLGTGGAPPVFGVGPAHITGTVIIPGDRIFTHPGADPSTFNLVAFRAPVAADYRIDSLFSWQDIFSQNFSNKVGITSYFQAFGQPAQINPRFVLNVPQVTNSVVRSFGVGDIYGFVIDSNGSYSFDSTGLNFTATSLPAVGGVPEPESWALLIAGFGLTGAAMRRRHGGLRIVTA